MIELTPLAGLFAAAGNVYPALAATQLSATGHGLGVNPTTDLDILCSGDAAYAFYGVVATRSPDASNHRF